MNGLRFVGLRPEGTASQAIETPTPGVVIISVDIVGPRSPAPLHWRAGDWSKPPVDIEIDPEEGTVQAIQIVLQDEQIATRSVSSDPDPVFGTPLVDVSDWPTNRYQDVRRPVSLVRAQTNELVVDFGGGRPVSYVGRRGSLVFGWDAVGELCQLFIGPLSPQDWDDVDAFSRGVGGA